MQGAGTAVCNTCVKARLMQGPIMPSPGRCQLARPAAQQLAGYKAEQVGVLASLQPMLSAYK